MTADWTLWQQGVLLGLLGSTLVYGLYFRLWRSWSVGCDLLFLLAVCVVGTSVAEPRPFERLATELVERSPLPAALRGVDERMAALEALPGELIARALAKVGYESDSEPEPEPRAVETSIPTSGIETPTIRARDFGPLESRVRPSVERLLSGVLRVASLGCGLFLLLTALAMRSSTSTAQRLDQLSRRLEALEVRADETAAQDDRSSLPQSAGAADAAELSP